VKIEQSGWYQWPDGEPSTGFVLYEYVDPAVKKRVKKKVESEGDR
jgi:hypothetical protein